MSARFAGSLRWLGAVWLVVPGVAPTSASEPAASRPLEEIVVTARKREESILQIPVVATALSGDQLNRFATADVKAISEQVPGLLVGDATGSFGAQVSLRGVGTNTLNATIDQSVSLNIDGMQMTQGLAYAVGMFDVAQVEVLKGPQALFYGKSSPGGVISLRSAAPSDELEVILRSGYEAEAETRRQEFIVSGPVNDTLGLRLATAFVESEGYFKNEAVGVPELGGRSPRYRDFAPRRDTIVRGTARWQISHRLLAQLKLNYAQAEVQGDAGGLQLGSCPDGVRPVFGMPFLSPMDDCRLDDTVYLVDIDPAAMPSIRNGGVPFSDLEQGFESLELNHELSEGLSLTSVTGFYEVRHAVMFNGGATGAAGPTVVADTDFRRRDLTQELRLTSSFGSPANFMLGAFYQDGTMSNRNNLLGNTALPDPFTLPPLLSQGLQEIDMKTLSVFGQLIWDVSDRLELAAGARWTEEERRLTVTNTITGTPEPLPVAVPELSSDDIAPELTVTYKPTEDLTLFASYKQAFKSGSFNTVSLPAPGADNSFGDEKVGGFEAGIKTRLFDRALALNLAAYHYRYDDLQVGANEVSPNGAIAIRTLNAASATVYGFEADGSYYTNVEGLALRAGINYNHARYDDFDSAPCWGGQMISEGCDRLPNDDGAFTSQDLSGGELVRAPDWTATFGFDYERTLGGDLTLAVASTTRYSSEYYSNLLLREDMVQEGFIKTRLSIALRGPRDEWEVALIGNNLGDEITTGNCINYNGEAGIVYGGFATGTDERGPAGVEELGCNTDPGRELWLRFTLRPLPR